MLAFFIARELLQRHFDNAIRIAPDNVICSLTDRDWTLGILAKRQTGNSKHRRLLLHSAGIGKNQ